MDGITCWNFSSHNYLGFAGREDIENEAIKCIRKFGVGSCGPRAFLGEMFFIEYHFWSDEPYIHDQNHIIFRNIFELYFEKFHQKIWE